MLNLCLCQRNHLPVVAEVTNNKTITINNSNQITNKNIMKFKIIASVIVLLIIVVALFSKGCSSNQSATDENGNTVDTTTQQQ